jgi:hypothetical protein
MRVFVFDLLPYGEHLDHLKEGNELPWPLPKRHNMNRGAMPHAMFLAQIRRFGAEVLSALQAHEVKTTPLA